MPSLLIFSRDPGPTNQLVAALETLAAPSGPDEPHGLVALRAAARSWIGDVKVFARPPGEGIWRGAGFSPVIWTGHDDAAAETLIGTADARLVLTGADDIDEVGNRALWRVARARGIETHVALDHPANLPQRFDDGGGRSTYPDWFYVPDAVFAARAAEAGMPGERIRVTGDLHHARMARLAKSRSLSDIGALRAVWGASEGDVVILFASECAREMAAVGRSSPYDEVAVLGALLHQLSAGRNPRGRRVDPAHTLVVVRPHPRDAREKYLGVIAAHRQNPRVTLSAAGAPDIALLAADFITGMNSSLLYEAAMLGRPVTSLTGHDLSAGKSAAG